MKRITLWVMSTLTLLVMLFSYHTSTEAVAANGFKTVAVQQSSSSSDSNAGASQTTTSGSGASGGDTGTSGSTSTSGASSSSTSTSSSSTTSGTKTYTGTSVDTRYGPVQVKITVTNGKVTSAEAIDYPMENGRDQEINSAAIPVLQQETAGTTTSQINMVSGATYTSNAYIESLQSALDQANL